jgi:hypothetical protein
MLVFVNLVFFRQRLLLPIAVLLFRNSSAYTVFMRMFLAIVLKIVYDGLVITGIEIIKNL